MHTNLKCDAHAYTRSPEPWRIDAGEEVYGSISPEGRRGWKLFHYISGGGMRTFRRTLEDDERSRRQTRFLVFSAAVLVGFIGNNQGGTKMRKLAAVAFAATAGALFAQSGETAKDAFLRQQAYAEMQRVSGEVDVLRQNFSDLESKVRQYNAMKDEIGSLKGEIAALRGMVAELRREMQAQRGEIVSDLSKKIVKIQQSAPAASASSPSGPPVVEYSGKTQEYTVVSGDTLSVIARALGTKVSIIKSLNGMKTDNLRVGQKLVVPAAD